MAYAYAPELQFEERSEAANTLLPELPGESLEAELP